MLKLFLQIFIVSCNQTNEIKKEKKLFKKKKKKKDLFVNQKKKIEIKSLCFLFF